MSQLKTLLSLLIGLLLSSTASANHDPFLPKHRQLFNQAQKALELNNIPLYQQLHAQLDNYPLQPYLDYLYLRQRISQISPNTIDTFLTEQNDSFFADRLRVAWLDKLAKENRWEDYLQFYRAPQSAQRQCYYLQALLATGQTQLALEQTPALWLVSQSQDKACDPVFSRWQTAGFLTEELRQQRMLLALRDNQFAIASYLARGSLHAERNKRLVDTWKNMHDNPYIVLKQVSDSGERALGISTPTLSREIIMHGFARLARRSPEQAYERWQQLSQKVDFSADEVFQVRSQMGMWAALNRNPRALHFYGDTGGGEWHARAAIWQQDWRTAIKAISGLADEEQTSSRWQYWLGRSQQALGDNEAAEQTLSAITDQRDYYSFLAADLMDQPYQMNNRPIRFSPEELHTLQQQPAVQRLREFYAQNMMLEANREAYHLRQTRNNRDLQLIAHLTHEWGWHNQAISMLGKAQYWDALDLRFPVIYSTSIESAGRQQDIDPSWLLAIARQESAFNPQARSHAGAMGLMQLMPDTGRMISKLIEQPINSLNELYQPERNISLGSAYLRHVYNTNQRNPVLATAAYNAGPGRVSNWLPGQQLDAAIWAENIPFNETRHYVQTVMTYAAIFDSQRQEQIKPISKRMPTIQPKKP